MELPRKVGERVNEFRERLDSSAADLGKCFSSEKFDKTLIEFERMVKDMKKVTFTQSDIEGLIELLYAAYATGVVQGYTLMLKDLEGGD